MRLKTSIALHSAIPASRARAHTLRSQKQDEQFRTKAALFADVRKPAGGAAARARGRRLFHQILDEIEIHQRHHAPSFEASSMHEAGASYGEYNNALTTVAKLVS